MTPRDALIEAMARAICDEWGYLWDGDPDEDSQVSPEDNRDYDERPSKLLFRSAATAALAAIEAQAVVMPKEMPDETIRAIVVGAIYQSPHGLYAAMVECSPYRTE